MSPFAKVHLVGAGYGAILAALNWSWLKSYSRVGGSHSEGVAPAQIALLLSVAIVLYFAARCLRLAAQRLTSGRRVNGDRWIISWSVLWYLAPLLIGRSTTSNWLAGKGTTVTETFSYGWPFASWILLLAAAGLLLWQISLRLSEDPPPRISPPVVSS